MAPNRKRLILAVSALIGPAIIAASWAAAGRPAKNKPTTNSKEEAKIMGVLDDLYNEKYGMWNVTPEDGRLLRILTETMQE